MVKQLDQAAVREEWHARGFTCGLWVDPPRQVWEDYVHSTDELLVLLEGRLELEIGNRVWCPSIGEEILIPAGVRHSVRNIVGSVARWLYGYQT